MLGFAIPSGLEWGATVEWVSEACALGAKSIWCLDPDRDPITYLAALSQLFDDISLGLAISDVSDRPPLLIAKQLITLDHLNDGRTEIFVDDKALFASVEDRIHTGIEPGLINGRFHALWSSLRLVDAVTAEVGKTDECVVVQNERVLKRD